MNDFGAEKPVMQRYQDEEGKEEKRQKFCDLHRRIEKYKHSKNNA